MYNCGWWKLYKSDHNVKQYLRELFPLKIPLREVRFSEKIINGVLFDYLQCDDEVRRNLQQKFANFPSILMNFNVARDDTDFL